MALVRFGNGVAEMRGSIAGTTFSRVKGGAIARNRTVPVNPNSLAQANVRTNFAIVVASWNILGKAEIDTWAALAPNVELVNRLGEAYNPTARQLYLSINLAKQNGGLALLNEAPASPNLPDPDAGITSITGEVTAGDLSSLDTNVLTAQATTTVFMDMTRPHSPSITNVENMYRQVSIFSPTAAAKNLLPEYLTVFGDPVPTAENQVIRWRYRLVTTANPILSAYQYGSTTITAP